MFDDFLLDMLDLETQKCERYEPSCSTYEGYDLEELSNMSECLTNEEVKSDTHLCVKCGKYPRHITKSGKEVKLCDKCYKENNKKNNEKYKSNYIYFFKPIECNHKYEMLYIGSTEDLNDRLGAHLREESEEGKRLKEIGREFIIYYIDFGKDFTRDDLFALEDIIIKKYKKFFGYKPIVNRIKPPIKVTKERYEQLEEMLGLLLINSPRKQYKYQGSKRKSKLNTY